MGLDCFYVSAIRGRFGEVTNNSTIMSRHDALEGAHVHKNALRVTFGALPFGTTCRVLSQFYDARPPVGSLP